jgi:soluble lytic murein transglycosylase
LAPTSTPQSGLQLRAALRHQINGNYDQAILAYQAFLDGAPTPGEAREARYHQAESYLLKGDYPAAAKAWGGFMADYPHDDRLPQATLMLAHAYHAVDQCAQAIVHFQDYLAQNTILADLVYEWIGDCHAASGRTAEAIAAYRQALDFTSAPDARGNLREKTADGYLTLQDYDAAVAEYDGLLAVAQDDYYRAKIEYLAGQALAASGQKEAAHARYRRAVDNYPKAEYAYLSLLELVGAGIEVDEWQRGLVDYYAGKAYPDAYGAAIRAFDRYLGGESVERADEALYRKALAQRALGQPYAASVTLQALIRDHPKSNWLARAWLERAAALAEMGKSDQAVTDYQQTAALFPTDELAPQALWRAAKLREGEGAYLESAKLYEDVQETFPRSEEADEALWRAGLNGYRSGETERAISNWQALLDSYPTSSYRDRILYWLGKLEATLQSQEQGAYWDRLVQERPQGYYGLRAHQIRVGESVTATRLLTVAIEPPLWDAAQAETELLTWLASWAQVPTDTSLTAIPDHHPLDVDLKRGEALSVIGLRREALDTFDGVRAAAWSDPLVLAQLALFFRDQGFHGLAARSALRLAGQWPGGSIDDGPLALRRLAFPLAYADLLSAEAQARDLDPLLLAALVRQESLFEPLATSWAGARGLGQVMPATGNGIARGLGMDDFTPDDLYRPSVSMRFGAYYLAVQMDVFDDQILVALAAYNGGPGNTRRWLEAGEGDLDLFVELITASESQRYLQRVYEGYSVYEELYRRDAAEE